MDAPWRVDGQVALVTGGSRGIGRAVCLLLAGVGAHVVINYRQASDAARAVVREIEANGGSCESKAFDVTDAAGVQNACKEILDAHGRIDILVNNAGITRDQLFVRMKPEDWHRVLEVNLTGSYLCAKAVAKAMMRQRSGCIVNMASVAGLTGNPGQVNYSASKAGIIGLTKALAKELASRNIRVNAVAPGFIETDMTEGLSDNVKEEILTFVPLKRFGSPKDAASAVCFLVSPASGYITGQVLSVGGGLYM